jgi:hypothetical protein
MSRWGGFRQGKKRYTEKWDEMKSSLSLRPESVAATPTAFSYVEAKGIWNLRSTTEFPRSNRFSTDLTLIGTAIGTTSLVIPSNAQAGDLAISYGSTHSASVSGSYSRQGGFTEVRNDVDAADSAMISGYKILTSSDPNATVSGFNLSGTNWCAIAVFRPANPITSVTAFSVNGQATISDPTAQTINMSLAPSYTSILAAAFMSGTTTLVASVSPAMTEIIANADSSAFYTVFNLDETPTNITVDMPDEGDNVMQSWALAIN